MLSFDDDARVESRPWLMLVAFCIPALLGVSLAALGRHFEVTFGAGLLLVWVSLAAVVYAWVRRPLAVARPVRVSVATGALFLDGRQVARADRIRAGWVEPRPGEPARVHLRVGGPQRRTIELTFHDANRGRALLSALGIRPRTAAAYFWTYARPLAETSLFVRPTGALVLVLAMGLLAAEGSSAVRALAVVALAVLFAGVAVPTRVMIGADGVLLRWLCTERFVGWSEIVAIQRFHGGVVLALEGRRWLTLGTPASHERYHPEREACLERMRWAWRAYRQQAPVDPAVSLVRRAGPHTGQWVRSVRALSARADAAGYRTPAVAHERLWRIVEDPRADGAARTGAALALAPGLNASGRERMRSVAHACADPRVRIALTTAASDIGASASDAELAAVLDGIEEESSTASDDLGSTRTLQ
jgi:hypothetical protein